MMNPVRKGRRGEQEVARILYKAFYGEEPPKDRNVFVRTGFGRKQEEGDIIVPSDFNFVVEVKNRKVTFSKLMHELREWCKPYENLSDGRGLLLVFKFERKWWCAVDETQINADAVIETLGSCFVYKTAEKSLLIFPLSEFANIYTRARVRYN